MLPEHLFKKKEKSGLNTVLGPCKYTNFIFFWFMILCMFLVPTVRFSFKLGVMFSQCHTGILIRWDCHNTWWSDLSDFVREG